jgi:stage V sporulation protein R
MMPTVIPPGYGSIPKPGVAGIAKTPKKPKPVPHGMEQTHVSPPRTGGMDALSAYNRTRLKSVHPRFKGSEGVGRYPFDQVDIRLGTHPDTPYLNKLDHWMRKVWEEATKPRPGFENGWLQPMDTLFQVSNQVDLMEAAARSGFPTRYRHWSWGQDFNNQYQRQRFGLGRLYEMVINTNPSYAFLYDRNPVYAQKVVMAHVLGHTDFFRNNVMYSETNRNMVRVMADHKAKIERYYQDPRLSRTTQGGVHPVEKFLNKFNALEWLVDMNALSPPPLESEKAPEHREEDDFGKVGVNTKKLGVAPWMQDFLYTNKAWQKYRNDTIQEGDATHAKTLKQPTRDILGFLVENAKVLHPWQQDILRTLREESYYFVPQVRTKLMNEGWATFWHHKLMNDCPSLIDESETTDIAKMMAGVEAPSQNGINPYQVGYAIFQNIYDRAAYGLDDFDTTFQPNKTIKYKDLRDRMEHTKPNEEAGLKKVLDVRKQYNDVEFIRTFFTPEVAEKLGMVVTNEREEWDSRMGQRVKVKFVESDDFNQLKSMILAQYQNMFPTLSLVDANHNNQGELLIKHENTVQDLDLQDTKETLAVLNEFWGHPIHLDTMFEVEGDVPPPRPNPWGFGFIEPEVPEFKRQPVRLSYKNGKMQMFTLSKDGKPLKNITDKYL